MARHFLTCVGNRDPYWLEPEERVIVKYHQLSQQYGDNFPPEKREGPILGFFRKFALTDQDRTWLFYTAPGKTVKDATEGGAQDTLKVMIAEFNLAPAQVKIIPLNHSENHPDFDPSDFVKVLVRMRESVQAAVQEFKEDDEIVILYSSGTPQMQAAWLLLVNSGLLPARLFRAEGEEVEFEPLFEDQLLLEACHHLEVGMFQGAWEALSKLEKRAVAQNRRGIFRIFARLARAYHLWSVFEYRKASGELTEAQQALLRFRERLEAARAFSARAIAALSDQIESQVFFVSQLPQALEKRLYDLFMNARRQFEQGNYIECVWRLDALCEQATIAMAIQAVNREWKVNFVTLNFADQVSQNRLFELVKRIYEGNIEKVPRHLSNDKEAINILSVLDPLALQRAEKGDFEWLVRLRNQTIHRTVPVKKNEAYKALAEARHYVDGLVGKEILNREDHPLRPEALATLAELFQKIGSGSF